MSIDNRYLYIFVLIFCIVDILFALIFNNYAYVVIFGLVIFLISFYLEEKTLILILSYFIASIIEFLGSRYISFFRKQ